MVTVIPIHCTVIMVCWWLQFTGSAARNSRNRARKKCLEQTRRYLKAYAAKHPGMDVYAAAYCAKLSDGAHRQHIKWVKEAPAVCI